MSSSNAVSMPVAQRKVLLNPGPSTTTDTVKMAQIVPDICPRETEFGDIMREVAADLLKVVHVEDAGYTSVLFCGSGTVCMDAAISSFLPGGKRPLIVNNGAYSSRAVDVCKYYGIEYVELKLPFDRPVDVKAIREALASNGDIGYVYTTHHETGTGVLNPVREIGEAAHEFGVPFIVDTTSSYAMIPMSLAEDNIDVCMASAQKGIQGMTGLSFIIAREDLVKASADYPTRSYYTNVYRQYSQFAKTGEMHFTPPVQTTYAARQALTEYFAEGEQAKWDRHQATAKAIHDGLARLGLRETIAPEFQSQLVVSVDYPDSPNWDFKAVHDYCYDRGFTIYPGKIAGADTFRLCTLGAIGPADIEEFMTVLEEAMAETGATQ